MTIGYELAGKIALVTGAAGSIGRAIALAYAGAGASVVVADRDEQGGILTRRAVEAIGGAALFHPLDVRKAEDHTTLVAATLDRFGRLDMACNNAGISGGISPLADYPLHVWADVIDINLSGVFYGMRSQIPAMLAVGGGSIVNIASVMGLVTFVGNPAYTAAKHGVIGLTKSAAFDYGRSGIRVNAVAPGFIDTPLLKTVLQDDEFAEVERRHLLGRLGRPEEVAELVLWLSSPRSSFSTGGTFTVDGGYLAQ